MQVELKVIPGAKRNLCKEENGVLKVYLSAPAVEGKANQALIKFLAQHFAVKSGQIEILKGLKSRHKVVNINGI